MTSNYYSRCKIGIFFEDFGIYLVHFYTIILFSGDP